MRSVPIFVLALAVRLCAADLTGEDIIRSAVESDKRQEAIRHQYLYHEHQENRRSNADGSPGKLYLNRDFEVIFLEGGFYRKLVAIDSRPLKPKQAREEEEKMRMTAAERKIAQMKKRGPRSLRTGVSLAAMLPVMEHKLLREEETGGRKYWVVQSEPKKGVVGTTEEETKALSYRYTTWIDAVEKTVLRKEWEVIAAGVDTRPGSVTTVLFARNDDAAWLPRRAEFVTVASNKNRPIRFYQTNTYSAYRKFTSETIIEFADSP